MGGNNIEIGDLVMAQVDLWYWGLEQAGSIYLVIDFEEMMGRLHLLKSNGSKSWVPAGYDYVRKVDNVDPVLLKHYGRQ